MAAQHDLGVELSGQNVCSETNLGFENIIKTSSINQSTLSSYYSVPSSSLEAFSDGDTQSRDAGTFGDSGCSEMELTSPGSQTSPERSLHSSMEVIDMPEEDDDDDEDDDDEDDDQAEVSSTISELSGISDLSGQEWKPIGPMGWIQRQMAMGANPREVLMRLLPKGWKLDKIPEDVNDLTLWNLIVDILPELPVRTKLPNVNTVEDVVGLIRQSKKILVLTGAGVSVSCGIPDFRSPTGVYARLAKDFPDLPDPQAMFDIRYFNRDPRPFYKFAREIYPGQFHPSPCHRFIRALETHGKLLRNYTQNIDTLEQVAGIERVVQCHGSFATATCTNCKRKVSADEIREDILAQRIPVCPVCVPEPVDTDYHDLVARGVMKPDIVFFGEGLPSDFHDAMAADRDQADLLLIIGSSLKVRPVALIPASLPNEVPQVLINRERLPHLPVDVELLGDADVLVDHLCRALGDDWKDLCWRETPLTQAEAFLPEESVPIAEPSRKRCADSESSSSEPTKRARLDVDEKKDTEDDQSSLQTDDASEDVEWSDLRQIKFRQMSSDSTRDSGIAEPAEDRSPLPLSARLPEHSYIQVKANRYIFPGAEVYSSRSRSKSPLSPTMGSPAHSPLPSMPTSPTYIP